MKTCSNCKYRRFESWGGYDYCLDYEMSTNTEETAKNCSRYEYEEVEDEHYHPCATSGDYSPGCPWNAPGMSVSDFI